MYMSLHNASAKCLVTAWLAAHKSGWPHSYCTAAESDVLSRHFLLYAWLLHVLPLPFLLLLCVDSQCKMAAPSCGNKKMIIAGTCALLSLLLGAGILVWFVTADTGPALLPLPYFRLKDLYEEPFHHGWGIDLPGYGPTLRCTAVQAHTLKPENVGHAD